MAPAEYFRQALAEGRLELQFCSQTGRAVFYPRMISPYSGQPLSEWRPVSGLGTVYSTTVTRRKKERGGDYNVALVDLDEDVRMMSEVRGLDPDAVTVGMRVKASIERDEADEPLVVFRPLEVEDAK